MTIGSVFGTIYGVPAAWSSAAAAAAGGSTAATGGTAVAAGGAAAAAGGTAAAAGAYTAAAGTSFVAAIASAVLPYFLGGAVIGIIAAVLILIGEWISDWVGHFLKCIESLHSFKDEWLKSRSLD